ncbi:hypothetical protein D3C85_1033760 [compost metagenome]
MCHAAVVVVTVLAATALGGIHRFVDRDDDVGDGDFLHGARQRVAATGAAHAVYQLRAAQLAK